MGKYDDIIQLPHHVSQTHAQMPLSARAAQFSAFAALTAFQNMRRETGAVVSEITEVAPCYRLQSSSSAPMALLPHWCIVTDTSLYYVNSLTGAVTAG